MVGPELLEARDARQETLDRILAGGGAGDGSLLFISANVPGDRKRRPGLARLLWDAVGALRGDLELDLVASGWDLLGPYHVARTPAAPAESKGASVALEAAHPAGRLLDVDVYAPDGRQVDRAALGLAPRACLLCGEPARECMRLRRHSGTDLLARVDALLHAHRPDQAALDPRRLAFRLYHGALEELCLTPKPGLVDRRDSGSHPDLSFAAMRASADRLPVYYEDLLRCCREGRPWSAFREAGLAAEARMLAVSRSNAHKGYLFLSGLVLKAAWDSHAGPGGAAAPDLRAGIRAAAALHFAQQPPSASHGGDVCVRFGLGGIRAEAEAGLPALFEHALPAYRQALERHGPTDRARFHALAELMQHVEDTTAAHRCGLEGLACLRDDGAVLGRILERGADPVPWLEGRNEAYRARNLTMGGVADCLALVFALEPGCQT